MALCSLLPSDNKQAASLTQEDADAAHGNKKTGYTLESHGPSPWIGELRFLWAQGASAL